MKQGLIIGGFALLSVVALTGWTRKTSVAPAYWNQAGTAQEQAGQYNPYGAPAMLCTPVQPQVQNAFYQQPGAGAVYYNSAPRRSNVQPTYVSQRTYVVKKHRPFSHSAAIVAGGAGVGAGIGALAGGGRGAGIGALAGGAAGLIYDRLTVNR